MFICFYFIVWTIRQLRRLEVRRFTRISIRARRGRTSMDNRTTQVHRDPCTMNSYHSGDRRSQETSLTRRPDYKARRNGWMTWWRRSAIERITQPTTTATRIITPTSRRITISPGPEITRTTNRLSIRFRLKRRISRTKVPKITKVQPTIFFIRKSKKPKSLSRRQGLRYSIHLDRQLSWKEKM